jgi:hydroxymethylglutaryl-CoA reductase (NADPH)
VLKDIRTTLTGKEVFLHFDFSTGDAAGQNMVTLATDAVCRALLAKISIVPVQWYIEGNMSGDKKATGLAFTSVRGKKVVADITVPKDIVREVLLATPDEIHRYWEVAVVGGLQSASTGMQGHYANALAALFMACGQDVACIGEAAVGVTRMDVTHDGDLYTSVTLPNLIVGTVGGGTHLPTARECLAMIGCVGEGTASKFAEICAAVTLAGELSICSALAKGHFSQAHAALGRKGTTLQ